MKRKNIDKHYLNTNLSFEERTDCLVNQMTLREKIAQMLHKAPPIPRLDVPAYNWWNECLHGVGRAGRATVFPQSIGLAATFNVPLVSKVAGVISDEARAKYHDALRIENRGMYFGLTYWTPNINIFRDPRWGRGQETYGECPYLTTQMGVAFIRALQGNHPKYLKLVATAKHYAVHSGPEPLRHSFNAEVSERDLRETYLPAFEASVKKGKVWSIMGAYNRTNGEPCCGSHTLLQKILRDEWKFPGYVVSDCWAIKDFHKFHKVTRTPEESVALAVRNGCDLNCGDIYPRLLDAVRQGLVTEAEITTSVKRLFLARFKLGMFDPPSNLPWSKLSPSIVNSPAHRKWARRAARESMVLLKNQKQLLPLSKDTRHIAVVGPSALNFDVLWGNYNGYANPFTTLFEGIVGAVSAGTQVTYAAGDREEDVRQAVKGADVIIAAMGFSPTIEGEEFGDIGVPGTEGGGDRLQIGLPGIQLPLLKMLKTTGKPVVLVLTGGSPIELNWAAKNVSAILMAWYPGEAGGEALADVLFGDYNPAGRLPVSFIKSLEDIPAFTDYAMKGRTYRYQRKKPLYPFGFGLSYTTFAYRHCNVDGNRVEVTVENTGQRAGDEVVQAYVCRPRSGPGPHTQLAAFRRIHLKPGESKTVRLKLADEAFRVYDEEGKPHIDKKRIKIHVGGGPPLKNG